MSVPPEVRGTGLTPQEWSSQDVSNRASFQLSAVPNSKLLLDDLHARKRTEKAIRLAPHIALQEDNIERGNVHTVGIIFLLNELASRAI